jgi:DNA-binding XRE family transcriptional regulator
MTIKEARIRACMTQKQLSELLGIPSRTIEDWEAGIRKPSDYVEKLAIQEINRISGGILQKIEELYEMLKSQDEEGGEE